MRESKRERAPSLADAESPSRTSMPFSLACLVSGNTEMASGVQLADPPSPSHSVAGLVRARPIRLSPR